MDEKLGKILSNRLSIMLGNSILSNMVCKMPGEIKNHTEQHTGSVEVTRNVKTYVTYRLLHCDLLSCWGAANGY